MHIIKILLIAILYINCTVSTDKQDQKKQVSNQTNLSISILEEIPENIRRIENLTIFKGDSEPTHTIKLIVEQIFGEDEESHLFVIYRSFEDENGKLIVWGSDFNRGNGVFIYNADGSFYKQLGRKGKGPGEYELILDVKEKAGKIFISDFSNKRLNEYSNDNYSIIRSIKFEEWEIYDELKFSYVEPRNDGNYLVAFSERTPKLGQLEITYQTMDASGNTLHNNPLIFSSGFAINRGPTQQSLKPSIPLNFMGNTIATLSEEDNFYTISTNEFLVKKHDQDGVYQSAFYYPFQGSLFDLDEYLKTAGPFIPKAHQIRKAFNEMNEKLPENAPFISNIIIDDEQRIWIAIPADAEHKNYEWWILKESGELIAKLMLPERNRIYDIKNGHIYLRKDNGKLRGQLYSGDGSSEEDGEYVVKYKIELTEK